MKQLSKKILVIEDEKPLARALELKLVHDGFEVKTLPNGEGAVSLIEKENFSVVICDLVMPKVDGFQILQEIKEKKLGTFVIVLTNLSQTEDEKRVKALGASEFFIKSDTPLSKIVDFVKEKIK